jgi:hypothetical protein
MIQGKIIPVLDISSSESTFLLKLYPKIFQLYFERHKFVESNAPRLKYILWQENYI